MGKRSPFSGFLPTTVALLVLLTYRSAASPCATISGDVFAAPSSFTGRTLLQLAKDCPVDFESKNYPIITSKCKGPHYPRGPCCAAFKQFACPYADQLNDLTTNCATIMFSYIHVHGNYPPGLFANTCREGRDGSLTCPTVSKVDQQGTTDPSLAPKPSPLESAAAAAVAAAAALPLVLL